MTEKQKGATSGKVVYNGSIVKGIVTIAISEVDGVTLCGDKNSKNKDGITVSFADGNVSADVTVSVRYGMNIPEAAYNIQQSVKHSVEAMTEYKVATVDVHVVDVLFDENDKND